MGLKLWNGLPQDLHAYMQVGRFRHLAKSLLPNAMHAVAEDGFALYILLIKLLAAFLPMSTFLNN